MKTPRGKRVYVPGTFREGTDDPRWPARAELAATIFERPLTSIEACGALMALFKARGDDAGRQLLANCEAYGYCKWNIDLQAWVRATPDTAPPVQVSPWDGYQSPSCGMAFMDGTWIEPPKQVSLPAHTGKGSPWRNNRFGAPGST